MKNQELETSNLRSEIALRKKAEAGLAEVEADLAGAEADLADTTADLADAEADLADTEEIFRLLVDAVDEYAIFALDPNGHIISWNAGGQRLKGYAANEIIGSHFRRFYTQPDIDRKHPEFELEQAAKNGKYEEEGWRLRKDGSRFWANIVITALRDKNGKLRGFGKVTRDLTDRKLAEESLKFAYAQLEDRVHERTRELLEQKQRAEDAVKMRDEFFSMASHELKTPLSVLKLQAQIRRRKINKNDMSDFSAESIRYMIEDDEKQINRLVFLVDNMLDVSRLTSGRFELVRTKFDLAEMTREITRRMDPILHESGNTVALSVAGPTVGMWDRHRLEQALINLLTNASKYAPGTPVDINLVGDSQKVCLTVRDYGRGVSRTDQNRIFQPFERLKTAGRHVSGLGLGLYITKRIVEAHCGELLLQSEEGKGAAFTIELPLAVTSDVESE